MALDRDRITRAALDLLDETGLDGLALRELAGRLGVKAPALYWHFPSKAALIDEMATTMLRDLLAAAGPVDRAMGWREFMTASCGGLHAMMLGRRDGARVFSGTYLTDDSLVGSGEVALSVLTRAGFALRDASWGWQTAYAFVVGFTIEEQAVRPVSGERDERFAAERRISRLDPVAHPLSVEASASMFDEVQDRFDFGLAIVLDGLALRLHRS